MYVLNIFRRCRCHAKSGPDVGRLLLGAWWTGLDWPVMVGWTDSGKWAVFKTCMWPMRKTGGELKAVGDFAYAIHRRPLNGQSTRQATPKRNIKHTDIHRNNGAGKCDRCAYAPTMFPKKRPARDVSTLVRRFRFLLRRRIVLDPHPARSRVACHQTCFMISSSKRTSTKLHDNALATNGRASTHKY
jgi:hypothetical protein